MSKKPSLDESETKALNDQIGGTLTCDYQPFYKGALCQLFKCDWIDTSLMHQEVVKKTYASWVKSRQPEHQFIQTAKPKHHLVPILATTERSIIMPKLEPVIETKTKQQDPKMQQQVTKATEWLHSRGYCHTDIFRRNILKNASGDYLLADFDWITKCEFNDRFWKGDNEATNKL